MGLPSKNLEQIAINTKAKIEGHKFIVMNKSVHEEHLSQPLQTNKKQSKKLLLSYVDIMGLSTLQTKKLNSFSYEYLKELNKM